MPPVSFVLSVLAGNSLRAQEPYTTPSFIPRLLYHKYVRFGQEEHKKIAETKRMRRTWLACVFSEIQESSFSQFRSSASGCEKPLLR